MRKMPNTRVYDGDGVVKLMVTGGDKVIVDYDYLEKYGKYRVCLDAQGYPKIWMNGKRCFLHRIINNTPSGYVTDHINGDILDNRKKNLRACLAKENGRNINKPTTNTSGFKGVCKTSNGNKYRAYIRVGGKHMHIGAFSTPKEAALAYNEKAKEYYGEFCRLNDVY